MPHRLREDEKQVDQKRGDRSEGELAGRELLAQSAGGERGQHQAQRRQRGERGQRGAAAFGVEHRHAVAPGTEQQRQTGDPVGGDHHRGEHGVPGQRRRLVPAGRHQLDDEGHLDHRHRGREHQRPERLTDPVGDHLRVMHGGQHGTDEQRRGHHDQYRPQLDAPDQCQHDDGKQRYQHGPGHPSQHRPPFSSKASREATSRRRRSTRIPACRS